MIWYKPTTKETLYGVGCLKHKVTKEKGIFGKYGEVWDAGLNHIGFFVKSNRVNTQLALALKTPRKGGDKGSEPIYFMPSKAITLVCKYLRVPTQTGRQIKYTKHNAVSKET